MVCKTKIFSVILLKHFFIFVNFIKLGHCNYLIAPGSGYENN